MAAVEQSGPSNCWIRKVNISSNPLTCMSIWYKNIQNLMYFLPFSHLYYWIITYCQKGGTLIYLIYLDMQVDWADLHEDRLYCTRPFIVHCFFILKVVFTAHNKSASAVHLKLVWLLWQLCPGTLRETISICNKLIYMYTGMMMLFLQCTCGCMSLDYTFDLLHKIVSQVIAGAV